MSNRVIELTTFDYKNKVWVRSMYEKSDISKVIEHGNNCKIIIKSNPNVSLIRESYDEIKSLLKDETSV